MVTSASPTIDELATDEVLPAAPSLLDPCTVAQVLVDHDVFGEPVQELGEGLGVEVLLYRPRRRCTVRYRSRSGRSVVAKAYHSRSRAVAAHGAQTQLFDQSAGNAVTSYPEPLAHVEPWAMVVMEDVAGASMRELLAGCTREEATDLVRLAGSVLAELRSSAVSGGRQASGAVEASALIDRIGAAVLDDDVRSRSASIARLAHTVLASPASSALAAHGDFTPSQLLVDEAGRITVVDFDRVGRGDPAVDIGTFMAKLVRDAVLWERPWLADLRESFYDAAATNGDPDLRRRCAAVDAVHLARMAVSRLDARRSGSRPTATSSTETTAVAAALLHEAERCLNGQ